MDTADMAKVLKFVEMKLLNQHQNVPFLPPVLCMCTFKLSQKFYDKIPTTSTGTTYNLLDGGCGEVEMWAWRNVSSFISNPGHKKTSWNVSYVISRRTKWKSNPKGIPMFCILASSFLPTLGFLIKGFWKSLVKPPPFNQSVWSAESMYPHRTGALLYTDLCSFFSDVSFSPVNHAPERANRF